MTSATTAYGSANTSRRTKAARSSGDNVSSTTSSAMDSESASSAAASGSASAATGSGSQGPEYTSRRALSVRSRSSDSRLTTVVRKASGFLTVVTSVADHRSQASCTTSSASTTDPRIR